MGEKNMNQTNSEGGDGKKRISVNVGLLAGLLCGAVLGSLIGAAAHDVPLYTGFGMLIGMAVSFDMAAFLKGKRGKSEKKDEMRE